ncbi:MAG TPA: hypothetical protein VFZ61_24625 [Polyangiales bacterium]
MKKPAIAAVGGVLLGAASALVFAGGARAYSDIERFTTAPGLGGGGGRYFTGSPVDGYACSVCHTGGAEPKVQVLGLPEDGYAPGKIYQVEVVWDNPEIPLGLQLEMVGRDGRAAGQLLLVDERQIDEGQLCTTGDRLPADYELRAEGRKVLGVQACGARHMRFRFAPPDTPDVSFSMSAVTSDKSGSVDGDGAFALRKILRRAGEPAPKTSSCALTQNERPRAWSLALLMLSIGALAGRRWARPR